MMFLFGYSRFADSIFPLHSAQIKHKCGIVIVLNCDNPWPSVQVCCQGICLGHVVQKDYFWLVSLCQHALRLLHIFHQTFSWTPETIMSINYVNDRCQVVAPARFATNKTRPCSFTFFSLLFLLIIIFFFYFFLFSCPPPDFSTSHRQYVFVFFQHHIFIFCFHSMVR